VVASPHDDPLTGTTAGTPGRQRQVRRLLLLQRQQPRRYGGRHRRTTSSGICHTWTADGRCISLLKILLTNSCIFDCAYCVNRRSNPVPRTSLTPDEIVRLTMGFYRRNYIEGLFLSTGVSARPTTPWSS
jgi:predicted DNA-binding helix-hairpin-helix protein